MRKKTQNFTAVIYPDADSDWLVAHNPETGTTTQGKTFEEALANLKEATELYLTEFPLALPATVLTTVDRPGHLNRKAKPNPNARAIRPDKYLVGSSSTPELRLPTAL